MPRNDNKQDNVKLGKDEDIFLDKSGLSSHRYLLPSHMLLSNLNYLRHHVFLFSMKDIG